jgi:hypothetical protein
MEQNYEQLGQLIDKIENLSCALSLPLPDSMHVEQLRKALPKSVQELKDVFTKITGENPWE